MKPNGIAMCNIASNWVIYGNHIRGLHDGIGTNDGQLSGESFSNITIKYNRIENIHDDPIELEVSTVGETMGMVEIYGNFIGNSMTCASIGQQSPGTWNGPINFLSNVCVLMRPHHVNRDFANGGNTFNAGGGLRYGHQYAMKWGVMTGSPVGPTDLNTNVYNNTFVIHDSNPGQGIHLTNHQDNQTGDYFFNNILISVNGRVGTNPYFLGPAEINDNLYFTFNNPALVAAPGVLGPLNLLDGVPIVNDDDPTTTDCCHTGTCGNWECSGLGALAYEGSDPQIDVLGFGCIADGKCTAWAADPGVIEGSNDPNAHLQSYPSSWIWEPKLFAPPNGSLVCGAGRGMVPTGLPERPAVDPAFATVPFTASVIGAVPCGTNPTAFEYFPVNQAWTTVNLASNEPPTATIVSPSSLTVTLCKNSAVNLCGTYAEPDGAPPFSFLWDFCPDGAACAPGAPTPAAVACPGNVVFANTGTYIVKYTVTDRWGERSNGPTRTFVVQDCGGGGGGPGGCSDCTRCICDIEQ
jgi:hypothetical protein